MIKAPSPLQVDLKQFEGMNISQARKDKKESEQENDLDLKNKRGPKAQKEKPLKEVCFLLALACAS